MDGWSGVKTMTQCKEQCAFSSMSSELKQKTNKTFIRLDKSTW